MTEMPVQQGSLADCCIVGAGLAGAVLAYLLARRGLRVALLEACHDFDRDFRGDTFHPGLMEIMEELGPRNVSSTSAWPELRKPPWKRPAVPSFCTTLAG